MKSDTTDPLEALTQREIDCLRLVNELRSSKEIGRFLGISPTSVDTYVRRAMARLNVTDRYAAAKLMRDWERRLVSRDPGAPRGPGAAAEPRWRVNGGRAPPLDSLNLAQRLMLVVAGSVVGAVAFGAFLTALSAL